MNESGPLVEVYLANQNDAELIRSMLEGNGIPATIARGGVGGYPLTVGPLGNGRVLVREEHEDAARSLIREATHGDLELDPTSEKGLPTRPLYWGIAAVLAGGLLALALWEVWNQFM